MCLNYKSFTSQKLDHTNTRPFFQRFTLHANLGSIWDQGNGGKISIKFHDPWHLAGRHVNFESPPFAAPHAQPCRIFQDFRIINSRYLRSHVDWSFLLPSCFWQLLTDTSSCKVSIFGHLLGFSLFPWTSNVQHLLTSFSVAHRFFSSTHFTADPNSIWCILLYACRHELLRFACGDRHAFPGSRCICTDNSGHQQAGPSDFQDSGTRSSSTTEC